MDELNAKIKEYLALLNDKFYELEIGLIDFVIGEVIDRVLLYLNSYKIPSNLARILANVVNTSLTRCLNTIEKTKDGTTDLAVLTISDNGQSISYSNEITRYFSTVSDDELFTGFTALLSRYRRVKVVHPKNNENGNS